MLLRLPAEDTDVFLPRLREAFPLRADKVIAALREMRGGRLNDPRSGARMEGAGLRWQAIDALFSAICRRLGYPRCRGRQHPVRLLTGAGNYRPLASSMISVPASTSRSRGGSP